MNNSINSYVTADGFVLELKISEQYFIILVIKRSKLASQCTSQNPLFLQYDENKFILTFDKV